MSYREHAPPIALEPWLECLWERTGEPGPPVRVLPDGCIDIVFTEGAGAQVVGANTTAFLVPFAGSTRVVGARMLPGCGPALLGIAAEGMRDVRAPVADALRRGGELESALAEADAPLDALRAELLARALRAPRPDPLVREAVSRLELPDVSIAALADDLGVSERQLRRRVTTAVGYGPRRLARVLRLGRALRAARAGDDLARVAFDTGYADQSHFTNDCRELAGVPPRLLLVT
jgi:AraC-like DNA-binding protein